MEIWLFILGTISIFFVLLHSTFIKLSNGLPPGPKTIPILGQVKWLWYPFSEIEPLVRSLHGRLGPMVTLHIGTHPAVFVSDRTLAHRALIQNGTVFADRPAPPATIMLLTSNRRFISWAPYGSMWRALRRNLTSGILHPSRLRSQSQARRWVLSMLSDQLRQTGGEAVRVVDHFRYAMFCLLALMCFGDKLHEKQIKEIEYGERNLMLNVASFNILNVCPIITKILLRKKWGELYKLRREQQDVLLPLIRARRRWNEQRLQNKQVENGKNSDKEDDDQHVLSYVDTLFDLELPEEKRKLKEEEIMSLCAEFLDAGTDNTATALQWITANLVKYPRIQEKVLAEMRETFGDDKERHEIEEEDLHKLRYLKAVVLEALRRHPPAHFVVPHAVTEDTVLGGFKVVKSGSINFTVAEMGLDPTVWEDPMEFRPERFVDGEELDITGSRGIKMMPFGAGRRICPGLAWSMLHLEYFVANLVWSFEWKAADGEEIDLSEKQEFTMVMKNPLRVRALPREE